ncbi:MAG TPA: DUF3037 domain-containing protein [Candidatus Acidoferrales bacterium]|nr:DUF3037 domain-containing protein [Candidatus Acidoferrales bacterium]
MPDLIYHVIRWTPNLIRDEWINIGVLLFDPSSGDYRLRLIEEESEFARLRRLHPSKHEDTLRNLRSAFEDAARNYKTDMLPWPGKYYQTMGTAVQLSQPTLLMHADLDVEIERLYHDKVRPVAAAQPSQERPDTRSGIRARSVEIFRSTGLLSKLVRSVRVDKFTFPGDPLRLDFSYRRSGTQGFIQCLSLARDPAQAKVLSFTSEAVRRVQSATEFTAITEREPDAKGNERDRFVTGMLEANQISVAPLERLAVWAHSMNSLIQ